LSPWAGQGRVMANSKQPAKKCRMFLFPND
jgi:hypothetical protein